MSVARIFRIFPDQICSLSIIAFHSLWKQKHKLSPMYHIFNFHFEVKTSLKYIGWFNLVVFIIQCLSTAIVYSLVIKKFKVNTSNRIQTPCGFTISTWLILFYNFIFSSKTLIIINYLLAFYG